MLEAAEDGSPASGALDGFSGAEARLLKGVILAGETSGRLTEALELAAASFARSAEMRARITTALIYPSFIIAATLATLACFLLLVVPTLAQAFAGAEDRLPESTRALLSLSTWLQTNGALTALAAAAFALLAAGSHELRRGLTELIDRMLDSPIGFGIVPRIEFAAFASLAALSLEAGVPSGSAFDAAAASVRNGPIRTRLQRAVSAIRMGEPPSSALQRLGQPPKSFQRLVHLGEETGRLADAMRHAGALLSSEAEQRLDRMGAVAGPIVTLALGGLVAGIVMSLFMGLLAMSDLATA